VCFNFPYNFVSNISHSKKNSATHNVTNVQRSACTVPVIQRHIMSQMYSGLHVQCPSFLSDFHETWIFSTDFWKTLKYKIPEYPSSDNPVVPGRRTDGRTCRRIAFRNFANEPKNCVLKELYSVLFVCLFACLFVCWLVCLFVCLLACLLVCLLVCLFVCLLACLFVCLFVCLFACLPACLFACLFVCLFVCLLVCLFACLFVCLLVRSFVRPFVCLFACLFVCLFVYLFILYETKPI